MSVGETAAMAWAAEAGAGVAAPGAPETILLLGRKDCVLSA
jgi:hypothetical protein